MKKLCLIIGLLFSLSIVSQAQTSRNSQKKEPLAVGIKGGLNMPRMFYMGNASLSQLKQKMNLTPTGGLFVEIPVGGVLMIAPEVMYVQRGTDIEYEHFSGTKVHYAMNVSYVDLRLPFELRWAIKPFVQPYLVLGAEGGMRMFGQIHIQRTAPVEMNKTIDVGDANMNLVYAGVFAGLGVRSRFDIGSLGMIVKLSASYHQGLLDTYAEKEKEGTAQPVNVNAYQITGSRLPRGIEVTLGIAIPLESKPDDACASFSKDRRWVKHSKRGYFGY